MARMQVTPVHDAPTTNGRIREHQRMVRDLYLVEIEGRLLDPTRELIAMAIATAWAVRARTYLRTRNAHAPDDDAARHARWSQAALCGDRRSSRQGHFVDAQRLSVRLR
jgi:hypothetical protein